MKKFNILLIGVILFALSISTTPLDASSATTYTRTINRKRQLTITQDAYLPDRTLMNLGLSSPSDLYIGNNGLIFIADTGNRRVVAYDPLTDTIELDISHEEFVSPTGIFITEDNDLYVADGGAEAVFQFALSEGSYSYTKKFIKPDSVSFETKNFAPLKVAVDRQDTLYLVVEGVFDGIVQISDNNEFLGYFATNEVVLTPAQQFQNLLFSDKQLEQLSNRNPVSFSNVYVNNDGIKFSTSIGDRIDNVKKHNTNGSSSIDTNYGFDMGLVDVVTDDNGVIYSASEAGYIYIFTNSGSFIFRFGSSEEKEDVSGLYSQLVSIDVDENGKLWTLDKDKAFIQSYEPTAYSLKIYEGLTLYQDGEYEAAIVVWEEVLKLNQLSVLAHNEIGRNMFSTGRYEESLEHFKLAGSRYHYSQSFWEVRNVNIQQKLPGFLIGLIAFGLLYLTVKMTNKKYAYLDVPKEKIKQLTSNKWVSDVLYAFSFIKHPIDSFYYLKKGKKGSYYGATVWYGIFFVSYMVVQTSKGFIYQFVEAADMDIMSIVLGFFAILILFILSNYLVTSINDGEGSLSEIYLAIGYTFVPIIIGYALVTYLSYQLTFNEVFILEFTNSVGVSWTVLLIYLAVQELHNYTIRETIKSFLLTFLFMIIVAILFAFIQIMGDQLIQFIIAVIKEAIRSVFS